MNTKYKIGARSAWDNVEIGTFDTYEEAKEYARSQMYGEDLIKEFKPLRSVDVTYSNGETISTSMAAGLTDEEIKEYFAVGRWFNIGVLEDNMQRVTKIVITG